jgi:homoserine acetyltransferase
VTPAGGRGRDGIFPLGAFPLACGKRLLDARIAYRVFGELNAGTLQPGALSQLLWRLA